MATTIAQWFGDNAKITDGYLSIRLGDLGLEGVSDETINPDQVIAALILNGQTYQDDNAFNDPTVGALIEETSQSLYTRGEGVQHIGYIFNVTLFAPSPVSSLEAKNVV
ncbi:MAG: hypothetical protein F6K63_29780 [Moorea sp. SIO1G6]|uniref:hypothetical protein n=1 Tax=Moorena sp. SIO1G6 TaxID=2607840 RepID=UPI0013BFD154|nr:hypothetical protein [Moorena sp. SIO1G6]NET68360.1 hypothetical protein [Moorena sp. SIO1G6]